MRPIVEIMTVNFSLLALDQIMNNAATLLHMSGGQFNVPLVIRMTTGAGRQLAAQHSHSLEGWYAHQLLTAGPRPDHEQRRHPPAHVRRPAARTARDPHDHPQLAAQHSHSLEGWYAHIPGIKVLAPGTVEDARGMLWPALEDPDPVLIFEHGALYNTEGELARGRAPVDIDRAASAGAGGDVTLITYGGSLPKSLAAAERAGRRRHRRRGHRPAHAAAARRRHDHRRR